MKAGLVVRSVAVAVICCTMLVGCKACKKKQGSGTGTDTDRVGAGAVGDRLGEPLGGSREGFAGTQDREPLRAQTVYFAFDSAAINPSEQPKIEAVAAYLKANAVKLLIEGHCDERGTHEYNRALGERRAQAVRDVLISLGVSGDRIQTISYGEEQPADPGHDEAAWAKNRRAEFVVIR